MYKIFIPKAYSKNIYEINYDKLKKKGIKCILFDLDNTISPEYEILLNKKIKTFLNKLKKDFKVIIMSNNFPHRLKKFGKYYDVDVLSLSLKPLLYKYIYVLLKYRFKRSEIVAVGDQLVTDILGGNKIGITTILVDPMTNKDGKATFLNRKIEKKLYSYFKKNNILEKGKYYE
ncbi:MAG: YqeG family HAD IIIA-type phosphatase [Bacilli bacterium]|nr:YqeG family HAD IIIA-type phosphatase [Bacilli bacterium]